MHKIITRFGFTIILAITCQFEIFSQSNIKSQLLSYVPPVVIRYTKSAYRSLPNINHRTLANGTTTALHYTADNWKPIVLGTVCVAGAWAIYKIGYRRGFNEECSRSNKQSKINKNPITSAINEQSPGVQNIRSFGTSFVRFFFGKKSNPSDE